MMVHVSAPDETTELAGRLRLAVTRLARRMRQEADAGLSPTLLTVLATIDRSGPLTLGELATREQVAPPTITKAVGALEEKGLVLRSVDPDDRRVVRVETTTDGRRLLERTRTRRNAWLARRLQDLPPSDRALLAAALESLERLGEVPHAEEAPR